MIFTNDSISGTPNNNWLVSFTEALNYIKLGNDVEPSLSGFLVTAIQIISDKFEEYIGHGIIPQTYVGYYNGTDNRNIYTENFPINTITTLQKRNSPTDDWQDFFTGSLTANIFNNSHYIELYQSYFPCGRKNIKVVYNAGYNSVPGDIKQCALEAIRNHYDNSKNNQLGLRSKSNTNTGTVLIYEDLWEKHQKILDKYRTLHI